MLELYFHLNLFHLQVKLVKCLVDNIVVDMSFNQLSGLCTLCFLEEVCHLFLALLLCGVMPESYCEF